jgi:hypothetical protein
LNGLTCAATILISHHRIRGRRSSQERLDIVLSNAVLDQEPSQLLVLVGNPPGCYLDLCGGLNPL